MARPESGKRTMGWTTATALLAVAPLLSACSGGAQSSSASHSSSSSPSTDASDKAGPSSGSSAGAPVDSQSTVSSAVGAWVTAVIEQDAKRACLLGATTDGASPAKAKPATPQTCDASTTKKMAVGLKSLSKAFTPQNASGKPTVKVDAPTPKGDEAVVPSARIIVDGKPLRAIMLSRSHGVNPKDFTAKVETERVNGKWYIGDFDLDSGHQTSRPQA